MLCVAHQLHHIEIWFFRLNSPFFPFFLVITCSFSGEKDGGRSVFNEEPALDGLMRAAAKWLNLKVHPTGPSELTVDLAAPTDIEGHLALDGRYYVLGVYPFNDLSSHTQRPHRYSTSISSRTSMVDIQSISHS